MITNPNYRLNHEEEHREEEARERYEREQQRKWINNQSKHVLDPDREWPEEEGKKDETNDHN